MLALAPAMAIFYHVIGENAVLVCCFIFAGFLWLISFTLASMMYKAMASQTAVLVIATVAFTELARWALYVIARESAVHIFPTNPRRDALTRRPAVATAIGLGIAVTQTLVVHGQVLAEARGYGTYYSPGCSAMPLFVSVAIQCSLLTVLQVLWTMLFFDGLRRGRRRQVGGTVAGHFGMMALNMTLREGSEGGCVVNIAVSLCTVAIYGVCAYRVFHSRAQGWEHMQRLEDAPEHNEAAQIAS